MTCHIAIGPFRTLFTILGWPLFGALAIGGLIFLSSAIFDKPPRFFLLGLTGIICFFVFRLVVLALVALVAPRETISFAEGVLSIRGISLAVEDIAYIYEDEYALIVQAKDNIPGFLMLGYCYKFRRRIVFVKSCIKNGKELSELIKSIPAPRQEFLPSRIVYYVMSVLGEAGSGL